MTSTYLRRPSVMQPSLEQVAGSESESKPTSHRRGYKPSVALPMVGRGPGRRDTIGVGSLPPLGLLLARPVLLAMCALLGALSGYGLAGKGGYQAEAILEFTPHGADAVLVVKQTGQTLERSAVAEDVIQVAAASLGAGGNDLARHVTAQWTQDTQLVAVRATADSPDAAVADANAVAQATVQVAKASSADRLTAARDESNQVLNSQQLDSADAESARRAQLGSALAARQDAIGSESGDLTVADPATAATNAGLTRAMGLAIGLAAGLLIGGLASLLLGLRGLRASSERSLRYLVPETDLSSPSQAAQLAGQIVESGKNCLAVVVTEGAREQGVALAQDIAEFVRAHGKTVTEVSLGETDDRAAALVVLRHDVRDDIPAELGVDLIVIVVSAAGEAAAFLEGQSNLRALVVMRRRRTPISSALRVMKAFERAEPVLVLAR